MLGLCVYLCWASLAFSAYVAGATRTKMTSLDKAPATDACTQRNRLEMQAKLQAWTHVLTCKTISNLVTDTGVTTN